MNLNCTTRAIKYLMFTFNFLFVLTGLVLISVGATIHSNYNAYDVFLDGKYFTLPNLLIATGILIFIISFLGCYGAYKESWIMLFGFSILLGVIFIFEFSAGIAGYVLRDKTLGYLGDTFRTTMPKYNQSSSVAYMWDTIQREFTCCGIEGPKDWVSVLNQSEDLPMSCCPKVDGLIGTQHCNIYVVPTNVTTPNNNTTNQTTLISTNETATDNSTESTTEDSTTTSMETTISTTLKNATIEALLHHSNMNPISKREQEEKDKVLQNRIIYSLPVHSGMWDEELALIEEKKNLTTYKKEHCQLLLQKTRRMFRNVLKPTVLAIESPYVVFGQLYQLKASDLQTLSKESSGLYLSGVINERDIDISQHFIDGCGLSASPVREPSVRNTFKFVGCHIGKNGQQIFYGEDILLQIADSSSHNLYVQCKTSNTDTVGGHMLLNLSEVPDIYCRFKCLHWNPQKRDETTGTNTFKPNTRVIIQHTASGRNLAVEGNYWIPSFFGPECRVSCHTYRDSHKMETAENFWKIVPRPISNTELYVRAAKGEDIPSELYS